MTWMDCVLRAECCRDYASIAKTQQEQEAWLATAREWDELAVRLGSRGGDASRLAVPLLLKTLAKSERSRRSG
jgi:hypothetical protein